jgi:hypothetical protein
MVFRANVGIADQRLDGSTPARYQDLAVERRDEGVSDVLNKVALVAILIEQRDTQGSLPYLDNGAKRFKSSNQFNTRLTCVGACSSPPGLIIKKRRLSGETS